VGMGRGGWEENEIGVKLGAKLGVKSGHIPIKAIDSVKTYDN
jgi:hypothetical protein